MPTVSANDLTTLASFPHSTRLGMAVFRPTAIVTGVVSGTPSVGATSLTLTGISTTRTPYKHYTVIAGSSAGASDGGKTRMKTWSSPTLTIAANNIIWQSYPYISILEEILPWAIIPDTSNDKEDGDVSYTNENLTYHPLAICGPPAVGWTNQVVKFWSNSDAVASGATISSHSWTFPSGSPASSSSAGTANNPIQVTWAAATGHTPHYMRYTVTDSNGKTHTAYRPVWIFSDFDDSYCDWELESLQGDYESGGWQARIRVFGDASVTEFPVDAMVVIFAEDRYEGLKTSIGGNWDWRENIIFVGWIARDTVFKDDEKGDVSFELVGPALKMKELNCWPANLEYVSGTPDTWHKLKGMTCDLAAFHILTEHTTLDHICDVILTGNTKVMRFIDIPEGDPYQQIDEYCMKPIGARLLSDRQGRMYFSRNPNLRPTSERTAIATVISLNIDSDIRADPGLDLATEEHEYQCSQVDFVGFGYDGSEARPWYSLAPEHQYETGRVEKVDGIRADSQSEANQLSGLYLANANNIWREVRIPMFNYRVFDIAPEEYTHLTLTVANTRRGVTWTNQDLICRTVEIEYDRERGALFVTPSFEKDSYGPSGVTGNYPTEPPQPTWDFPVPELPAMPPDVSINPQALLIGDGTNGVWFIPSGAQSWEERNTGLDDELVQQVGWDPWWFTAEKQGTSDPSQAIIFVCKIGKIYRSTDCGVTWTDVTPTTDPDDDWSQSPAPTAATVTYIQRVDNIHKNKQHIFLATYNDGGSLGTWLLKTNDDGMTWTWKSLYPLEVGSDGYYYAAAVNTIRVANDATFHAAGYDTPCWTPTIMGQNNMVGEADGEFCTLEYDYAHHNGYGLMDIILDMGATLTTTAAGYVEVKAKSPYSSVQTLFLSALGIDVATSPAGPWTNIYDTLGLFAADGWGSHQTANALTFRYIRLQALPQWSGADHDDDGGIDAIRVVNVSSAGGDDVQAIWADLDSEDGSTLWLVVWRGTKGGTGTLYLQKRATSNLSLTTEYSLGSCTEAELTAKTYWAAPHTPQFDKDICYVFGRMAAPQSLADPSHLIKTENGGTSFSAVETSFGTDHIGAFRAEGNVASQRVFYAIRNSGSAVPKLYKATEGLSYISDLPFASGVYVLVDAMSVKHDASRIAVGGNTAGTTMVAESQDAGATWVNITKNLPQTGSVRTVVYI